MRLHRLVALTTLLAVLALTALVWFFPSNDDFRAENRSWNGGSETLGETFRPVAYVGEAPTGSVLILIPYIDFTGGELQGLKDFLDRGGTLVLADDYGYGNRVLEYLTIPARFSGQPLLDALVNDKNQWFPSILNLKNSPLTDGVDKLVLNHATALMNVSAGEVIAQSSIFSYLDLNANEKQEGSEPAGPFPIISRHSFSVGEVVLIADPSLLINSMSEMDDNQKLIKNIAALKSTPPLIDQSHLVPSNLHQTKDLLASLRQTLSTAAGTLGVVTLALSVTLLPLWRERRQS